MPSSRLVPGRYPPVGTSPIADAIRERRGARGLTALDGTLLHGWNSLLGAIRTKGKLSGDVRELMILRVAAHNHAAYEWIHHEHVGRSAGLTTEQLLVIRDTSRLPTDGGVLSALQRSALAFAQESTNKVKVSPELTDALKKNLEDDDDLFVEAAAVVATYNMVSRFLISLDVGGGSDDLVPWPADEQEHKIPLSSSPSHYIYAKTYIVSPSAPWLVFCNSLLTNTTLWNPLLTYLLAPPRAFNILLHDQRGHGASVSSLSEPCTMPILAQDVAHVLASLGIKQVHSVIGVSQGGAVALSFGTQFPHLTKSIVACDTSPKTPAGNKEAWEGMKELANITVPRWFPSGSAIIHPRRQAVEEMIEGTDLDGFALGAGALMEYDLYADGLDDCKVKTLLVAGDLDGGGNVGKGLKALKERWAEKGVTLHIKKFHKQDIFP
ncbi:beta-ketoadipate enol-lactone hydrolase [Desarmillaria tabescens]|uniref:Beta-ketoadipate enol-lactone hydrolase n=1 Tax=Armillaria tabescens TaxID=1929756 RepID=A0AA39JEB1_ARMTA|nr:beta-ketoadipate enol-lactone hydrolase [Desarmillaria tabescens]KAK0440400.1 beta-ketoadipate enol-lactone hydrolase [Desarmillaria tabescens]